MAKNNSQSSLRTFLKKNLRKGYSLDQLQKVLENQGVSPSEIRQAISGVNPTDYESEAIDHISDIINQNLKKGFTGREIMINLENKGIDHDIVTKALRRLKGPKEEPEPSKPKITLPKLPLKQILIGIAALVLLVLIGYALVGLFTSEPGEDGPGKDCKYDKRCFQEAANLCELATVREDIRGSTIAYKSYSDCSLTKEFIEFSNNEPIEVVTFLEDKVMTCYYEYGSFPRELTRSVISSMDRCSGDLVTALYELELALTNLDEGFVDER